MTAFSNAEYPLVSGLTNEVTTFSPLASTSQTAKKKRRIRKPDVIYYPTPAETVAEMLRLANIQSGDLLYDLGSGDGRIPIAAAKQFGIRAVGIEIDPKLITEAESNAKNAGVDQLVRFRNEDMFRIDVSEATVVTLYLSEKLNVLLRPKLLRELRPGSRIISHDFRMGDWKPEQTVRVPWGKLYRTVFVWTVPQRKMNGNSRVERVPDYTAPILFDFFRLKLARGATDIYLYYFSRLFSHERKLRCHSAISTFVS